MITLFQQIRFRHWTRVVHVLLVLSWLLSSNSLMSFTLMSLAAMDRSHVAAVGVSEEGYFNVVLSHEIEESEKTSHVHEGISVLLTAFDRSSQSGIADHVLSLGGGTDGRRSVRRFVVGVKDWNLACPVQLVSPKFAAIMPWNHPVRGMSHVEAAATAPRPGKVVLRS